MGARSFDDEIAQVPSRDRADRYFAPNTHIPDIMFIVLIYILYFQQLKIVK